MLRKFIVGQAQAPGGDLVCVRVKEVQKPSWLGHSGGAAVARAADEPGGSDPRAKRGARARAGRADDDARLAGRAPGRGLRDRRAAPSRDRRPPPQLVHALDLVAGALEVPASPHRDGELVLANALGRRAGKLLDELDVARDLEVREVVLAPADDVERVEPRPGNRLDEDLDVLVADV